MLHFADFGLSRFQVYLECGNLQIDLRFGFCGGRARLFFQLCQLGFALGNVFVRSGHKGVAFAGVHAGVHAGGGVSEHRHGFDRLFGRTCHHQLACFFLNLRNRNGHVVAAHANEATRANNHIRDVFIGRNDQVFDLAHLRSSLVVNVLAHQRFLHAPTRRDLR